MASAEMRPEGADADEFARLPFGAFDDDDGEDMAEEEAPATEAKVRVRLPVVGEGGEGAVRHARPQTLPNQRPSKEEAEQLAAEFPADEFADIERPRTRRDCLPGGINEARPCPFVSCKAHLALDVLAHGTYASVKVNFPDLEVWEMAETCVLDIADRGGVTLDEVAATMNLTQERVRQIEAHALESVTAHPWMRELSAEDE